MFVTEQQGHVAIQLPVWYLLILVKQLQPTYQLETMSKQDLFNCLHVVFCIPYKILMLVVIYILEQVQCYELMVC